MSYSRKTDVICIVITVFLIGAVLLFMIGERIGWLVVPESATKEGESMFAASDLNDVWDYTTGKAISLDDMEGMSVSGAYTKEGDLYLVHQGVYILSGELKDRQIVVDVQSGLVQIVFNGVTLSNDSIAPFYVKDGEKVVITLAEGSENHIEGGDIVTSVPNADSSDGVREIDAAIYCACDLTINGGGSLQVVSRTCHGIKSLDHLIITDGLIQIESQGKGLLGKDSVRISGGDIKILESYEGIEGFQILIEDGTVDITSSDDGINASDGSGSAMQGAFGGKDFAGGRDFSGLRDFGINGDRNQMPEGEPPMRPESWNKGGQPPMGQDQDSWNRGGQLPTDPAQTAEKPGSLQAERESLPQLVISGGMVHVNAGGDGLDSNGDLIIEGGEIVVDGPADSGNGALDSGTESGGDLAIHGGTILAIGAGGMAESFTSSSTQYSFHCVLSDGFSSGDAITISDESGSILYEYTALKSGNSVVFSSPKLEKGTYVVTAGNFRSEITVTGIAQESTTGYGGMKGMKKPE